MNWKIMLFLLSVYRSESATVEEVIESCLIKVLKGYFLNQPVLLITDLTIDKEPFRASLLPHLEMEYHRHFIGRVMKSRKWTLQIYNTDKYVGLPAKLKLGKLENSFVFIRGEIIASDVLFEWEMDRLQKNPLWKATGKTVIVVKSEKVANNSVNLAKRVLEKMWTMSRSVNNLVMVAEESGVVHFYTWFPYKQPDCGKVNRVVHLDTFSRGRFQRKNDLFPEKVSSDLDGCELVAATDTCIPYVFADANNASKFVDGLEMNIINTLARMLNFRLSTTRPQNMWTTSVNNTLTGAFKLLVEHKIDMAFSCLMLDRERYLLALPLPSYYEDSLVWFVPSPEFSTHTVDIFFTFPLIFWLMMLCVMIASIALVVLLAYVDLGSNHWGIHVAIGYIFRLVGVSLYAPVEIPTEKSNFRLFILLFCLYSMHITIAFQSSLFALYRQPHFHGIYSSLEDAVNDGLFVYLRSSTPELYNQSDHALWNRILQPGRFDYLKDFGGVFSEIAYDKTSIALYIKTTGIYMISVYFTDDYGAPKILWLRQKFAPYPVTTFLSPGNPLLPLFEDRVYRLVASGLIRIWLMQTVYGGQIHFVKTSYTNSPLTMKHLGGPFLLLLLLLSGAFFVFIGEIFVNRAAEKAGRKKPDHRHFFVPVKPRLDSQPAKFDHGYLQ